MGRTADPERRAELVDAIVDYLVDHGLSTLSMRPLAQELGKSTRVLTHHFADKSELLAAALDRLGERQKERLTAFPSWNDQTSLGDVVRASWEAQLSPENLPFTRLLHEIEGLAAGGRLANQRSHLVADRLEFVTDAFIARGVPAKEASSYATLLNASYAGLQVDFLTTGDRDRTTAALNALADLVDAWIQV